MSFQDIMKNDPERWAEIQRRAKETRAANKAARAARGAAKDETSTDSPPTLADLGFAATVEDDFTVDAAGLLSAEEIAAAKEEGRKRYREDQRKKARKAIADAAYAEENVRLGTETQEEKDDRVNRELVQIYINMPRLRKPNGGEHDPEPIILDQKVFVSGRYYTVERHVANYLLALMDSNRRYVNQVDGRSRTYYAEGIGTMIYQGGTASGGPNGPSFAAIHRRPQP